MEAPQVETVTTPIGGHVIECRTTFTGYDNEQIRAAYNRPSPPELDLPPEQMANRKVIELCVVSVDGTSDNILDRILSMDARDYQYVVGKMDEISEGPPAEKKTDLAESTPSTPPADG